MQLWKRIELIRGSITTLEVDAIVNAANSGLSGGGGVDGAIHKAGGISINKACEELIRTQGTIRTGDAVITTSGNLLARYVIHTVGPVWKGGQKQEDQKLENCYWNSLKLAVDYFCRTIAFPNIATGIYGFPKDRAARIAVETICKFLQSDDRIEKVSLVCYEQENYDQLLKQLTLLSGPSYTW